MVHKDKANILIIDDDSTVRDILKMALSHDGYTVHEAENGEEGIEYIIKLCVPNLIIVDTHMPKMDGLTFLKQIRTLWNSSILPVIALTGDKSTKLLIDYYRSGLNDYISKPFNSQELLLRVETQIVLANRNVTIVVQIENLDFQTAKIFS